METCFNSLCNNPAEVERVIEAPFSMTASSSESKRTVGMCNSCLEQEQRMESIGQKETLG